MPFQKGNIPWTKGKKGLHLSRATEIKKGEKWINYFNTIANA